MWLDLLMTVPQSWWRCSILCSSACSRRRPACIPLTLWDAGMNGTQAHLRPTASAAPVAKSCLRHANCFIGFVQHADPAGWGNVCSTAKRSGGCSASQKPRVSSRAWEYPSEGLALEQSRLFYLQTEKSEISSKKLLNFFIHVFFCTRALTWTKTGSWSLSSSKWISSVPATHSRWLSRMKWQLG